LLTSLIADFDIHDTRLDPNTTAIFRTKLLSLRSDDKERVAKIVEGRPLRRKRRVEANLSYDVIYKNGSKQSEEDAAKSAKYWLDEWRFCHNYETDVSDFSSLF
jgi:hypothetical protein